MKTKIEKAPRLKPVIKVSKMGEIVIGEIDVRTGEKVGGPASGAAAGPDKPKKKDGDK